MECTDDRAYNEGYQNGLVAHPLNSLPLANVSSIHFHSPPQQCRDSSVDSNNNDEDFYDDNNNADALSSTGEGFWDDEGFYNDREYGDY